MKKALLIAFLATSSFSVNAQTKGTNTIGLGLNFQTHKAEQNSSGVQFVNEYQSKAMSVGYGHFINDNVKVGVDFFYGTYDQNTTGGVQFNSKTYGGNVNYQKYYPLLKKFYAFGGGRVAYSYSSGTNVSANVVSDVTTNTYAVGVNGGLTWFFSKRLALEADLLSANIGYSKSEDASTNPGDGTFKNTSTNFSLNTAGAVSGLGFKIYFLF